MTNNTNPVAVPVSTNRTATNPSKGRRILLGNDRFMLFPRNSRFEERIDNTCQYSTGLLEKKALDLGMK